jgi:hypothetical protein
MTNVEELIFALDVIKDIPEFASTNFIAKLNWKQIPEAYTKNVNHIERSQAHSLHPERHISS